MIIKICEIRLCLVDEADCYTSCNPIVDETVNEVRAIDIDPMESEQNDVGDKVEDDPSEDETITTTTAATTTIVTTTTIATTSTTVTEIDILDYEDVLHSIGNETHIFDI